MMARRSYIEGFQSEIHRAIWERIMTWGAPRMWSGLWVMLCLIATMWSAVFLNGRWYLIPLVMWGVGQAILKALTRWDRQWDQVFKAKPRYRSYYGAG